LLKDSAEITDEEKVNAVSRYLVAFSSCNVQCNDAIWVHFHKIMFGKHASDAVTLEFVAYLSSVLYYRLNATEGVSVVKDIDLRKLVITKANDLLEAWDSGTRFVVSSTHADAKKAKTASSAAATLASLALQSTEIAVNREKVATELAAAKSSKKRDKEGEVAAKARKKQRAITLDQKAAEDARNNGHR
jgi:hypothetical protein